MKLTIATSSLLLCACATTADFESAAPDRVYRSGHSRNVIAECLLKRITAPELRPERSVLHDRTTVVFTSADALVRPRPVIYLFAIRDAETGSIIEARRLGKASLIAAETCF